MEVPKKRRLLPPSTRSSADIIAGNDGILEQILVVLPAKSLVRFKSVSKHWKSLISGSSFLGRHRLNHYRRCEDTPSFILGVRRRESQFLIYHHIHKKLARFPLDFDFLYFRNVKILQSCNGLLLIKTKTYDGSLTDYYVVNPATKKFRRITPHEFLPVAICLHFDPSKEYYIVVALWKKQVLNHERAIDVFSVYSSATLKWKDGGEFPDVVRSGWGSGWDGVSCNDRAYFLRTTLSSSLYYCPEEEKLRVIPSPPKGKGKKYVFESNGHLHCIYISFNFNTSTPCFNILEFIGDKWLSRKTVNILEFIGDKWLSRKTVGNTMGNIGLAEPLLGMIRAEKTEDSMFLFHVPGQILKYRLRGACEVLVDYRRGFFYDPGYFQFEFKDAHLFVGSFASV